MTQVLFLENPKSEILNSKWFDKQFDKLTVLSNAEGLTILNKAEGQITNHKY